MGDCEHCTKAPETVPYVVHESDMARQERTIKRLWILLLVMLILLVGTNGAWIYYESQWQTEVSTEIEQDTDGGGNNYVVGGDFNGESKDQNHQETNP